MLFEPQNGYDRFLFRKITSLSLMRYRTNSFLIEQFYEFIHMVFTSFYRALIILQQFNTLKSTNFGKNLFTVYGFRAMRLAATMHAIGGNKLFTYFYTSSSGNTSVTIYDGLLKDTNVYAEIFYFCAK